MRMILLERNTDGSYPIERRIVLTDRMPPPDHVTAAFALAFARDRFLLTGLVQRGLDIPGGHVEPGESPEEAMRREVYEETGARLGPANVLAYEHFCVLGPMPEGYPFPYPDSYMVFYAAQVEAFDPLAANGEAQGRALLSPAQARQVPWVKRNTSLYEAGLRAAGNSLDEQFGL